MQLLSNYGALLTGHFVLSSGRHSDTYVQCARILQWPVQASLLGNQLAQRFYQFNSKDLVIVSPAMGGILIGQEVARALNTKHMFTERTTRGFQLRRGFELNSSNKVIIIEDVITTGKSTEEVISVVKRHNAEVVAIGSIINRSATLTNNLLYEYLLKVEANNWHVDDCPLCAKGIATEKPGSRGEVKMLV
jgi:orotate phosphoribosyltransferase